MNNYLSKINEIYSYAKQNNEDIKYYDKVIVSSQFNLMSASLFKLLPQLDFEEHYKIFNEIHMHNRLTKFEQSSSEVLSNVVVEDLTRDIENNLKHTPCIITTFHFGSYRIMNKFLLDNEISYTAVAPKAILEKERDFFEQYMFKEGDAKFIELEASNVALQILRELKNGRSVFVYMDGFRGNIQNISSECAVTRLLGQDIYVRKGIFQLASIAKVPIISSICYRKSKTDIRLKFFDKIQYDGIEDRDSFVQNTIDKAYNYFGKFLKKYTGQWEGWMYVYKQFVSSEKNNVRELETKNQLDYNKLYFNFDRYGIFQVSEEYFLFDRYTMLSYCIEESLYKIIYVAIKRKDYHIALKISDEKIKELYDLNVLVA